MAKPHAHFSNANYVKSLLSCFALRCANVKISNIAKNVEQEKIMELPLLPSISSASFTMLCTINQIARTDCKDFARYF